MNKLLVLSVVTVATCVYARAPQLNSRHDTLLQLGKMVAGVKTASLGMFAINILDEDPHAVETAVDLVRDNFDTVYAILIRTAESAAGQPSLKPYLDFSEEIRRLETMLSDPPAMPENVMIIEMALPQLRRLLTQQTLIETEHVAAALQVVAEMEQLNGEQRTGALLDDAHVERWGELVVQLNAEFKHIRAQLPAVWENYRQQLEIWREDYVEEGMSDLNYASFAKSFAILESYVSTEAIIRLFSAANNNRDTSAAASPQTPQQAMMLEQFTGKEFIDTVVAVTNIEDEHLDLTLSYASGNMPGRAFAQQYREFLHKHADFFSAEQIQKAERRLANLE